VYIIYTTMFAKTKSQNPKRHDDISKTPSETQIPSPWPRQRQHQAMMISIRRMSSSRQPNQLIIQRNQSPNQLLTPSNPRMVTILLGTVRTRLTPNPPYKPLAPSSRNTVVNACHSPLYLACGFRIPPCWF